MDTHEYYMRGLITRLIQKARIRTQDVFQTQKKDQVGAVTNLRTVQYKMNPQTGFKEVEGPAMRLMCVRNSQREYDYLNAKEFELAKQRKANESRHQAE